MDTFGGRALLPPVLAFAEVPQTLQAALWHRPQEGGSTSSTATAPAACAGVLENIALTTGAKPACAGQVLDQDTLLQALSA